MKHESCINQVIEGIKKNFPEYTNITPPIEFLSGRLYLNFTAEVPIKGKKGKKTVDAPVLLSKCPFCGEKYEDEEDECEHKTI